MNKEKEIQVDEWLNKWYPINEKSSDFRFHHPNHINLEELITNYWRVRSDINSLNISYSEEKNVKNIYQEPVRLVGNLYLTTFSNLKYLNVNFNKLSSLELPPTLEILCCNNSSLTSLNVTHCFQLKFLCCIGNKISQLDLRNNLNLRWLCCYNNQLKILDLRQNKNLIILDSSINQLEEILLDSIEKLEVIKLNDNFLTSFPYEVINSGSLIELSLSNNNLKETNISVFKNFIELEKLWIGNTDIKKIENDIYNCFYGSIESLKNLTKLSVLMAYNTHVTNRSVNYNKPSRLLKKVFDIKLKSLSLEEEKAKYYDNLLTIIEE